MGRLRHRQRAVDRGVKGKDDVGHVGTLRGELSGGNPGKLGAL
jgi:hypothetical protein